MTFRLALIQMTSSPEPSENIPVAVNYIREAAAGGAEMVMTPEMTGLLEYNYKALMGKIYTQDKDPAVDIFGALAKELGIWLLIGSLAFKDKGKVVNRSLFYGPDGTIRATYDKIHMFDVDLPNGESYRESKRYEAGTQAVLTDTPWGLMGLSICYDVRFPGLYRALAQGGAKMLTVPAAFTQTTGKAHWHSLLRARAIENGAYVFAPAQTGLHGEERKTFGHSLIIDPWGDILADGGEKPGVVMADIDNEAVNVARGRIASLLHDKNFEVVKI